MWHNQPKLPWESTHSWLQTVLWRASHFYIAISRVGVNHYTVNCAESVGTTSKCVLIQPFIDRTSSQYWLWRGLIALIRNKVQHTAVLQLLCDFACAKLVTGDSYVFYLGTYFRCRVNATFITLKLTKPYHCDWLQLCLDKEGRK